MALLKRVPGSVEFKPWALEPEELAEIERRLSKLQPLLVHAEQRLFEAKRYSGRNRTGTSILELEHERDTVRRQIEVLMRDKNLGAQGRVRASFLDGKKLIKTFFERGDAARVTALADDEAFLLAGSATKVYWLVGARIYSTADNDLTADDIAALANVEQNKKRIQLQKAHALRAMAEQLDAPAKREAIPTDTKVQVWQRDKGQCVECGSNQALEFDHIIPLAMGGSNTMRNLQLLCETCNRRKGASLG